MRRFHYVRIDPLTCLKVGYATRLLAEHVLRRARERAAAGDTHRREQRAYECSVCYQWHLSSIGCAPLMTATDIGALADSLDAFTLKVTSVPDELRVHLIDALQIAAATLRHHHHIEAPA